MLFLFYVNQWCVAYVHKVIYTLRTYGVPVSTRELLDLNAALDKGLMMQPHPENPALSTFASREDMYRLIRLCMVKDERHFDKFDLAMADYFEGVDSLDMDALLAKLTDIPKSGWI